MVIVAGIMIGIFVGVMPGLSASTGVALMVPFTYGMHPLIALILLAAVYTASAYGGCITAIAINTPGTPAAVMPDQVPEQIKSKRVKVLAALGKRLKQAFAQISVGRQLAVIPESLDKSTGLLTGYSHNYIQVQFAANPDHIGGIITVKGLQAKEGILRAELP